MARNPASLTLLLAACTVDGPGGATSLGDPTYGTTVGTTMTTTATTSASASSEGSSGSSSGDGEEVSDSGSTEPGQESSDGGSSGGVDEQPANGVYAACESSIDCVGAQYCVSVMPNVGFCSKDCEDPTIDCPTSPGGTATPACVAAMPIGTPAQVCALDCSAGKTCPGGMECQALEAAMVCV